VYLPPLIAELKSQDLAVILWITSAINTDNPDYELALEKGYFAKGREKYKWWKGTGGLIDYKNPALGSTSS
jgi:alpha-glucosidase (family GH31 glycosyl hydrolase)